MENVKQDLLDILGDKREIVTLVTKVARSGLSRRMRVFVVKNDNLTEITCQVSKILDLKNNDDGLLVKGCGMDMRFWLTCELSLKLFNEERKLSCFSI